MLKKIIFLFIILFLDILLCFSAPNLSLGYEHSYSEPIVNLDQNMLGIDADEVDEYYIGSQLEFPDELISMELRNTDVRNVLKYFASEYDLNIVIGEKVKGNITVSLKELPVREAFYIILKASKLGSIQEENVLRIDTYQELIKILRNQRYV